MGRFQSDLDQNLQNPATAKPKARPSAARKLAAAVVFGIERLEARSLFSVVANPGGPYTVNEGSSITLDGSGSTDNSGTITKYEWDLNYKGTFVDQVNGVHLSYNAGPAKAPFTVALEVVDSNLQTSAVATTTITTNDVLPAITVTGGGNVNRGDTVPISWTYTDPGQIGGAEPVSNWIVNWGDGSSTDTLAGSASTDSHVYAEDGTFTITVTSQQTVLSNLVTSSGTTSATVSPVLPVITLTGNSHVNELATYTLGFSAVDPSGIDTWAIDWGDNTDTTILPGTAQSATHAYATHGNYTVTATAIDAAGDSSQMTRNVIADDVAPAPTISGTPLNAINEGATVSLTATPNDPGSSTTTYAWSVTRNTQPYTPPGAPTANAQSFNFVPGQPGTYIATCIITDDANETGSASTTQIIVNAVNPTVTITGAPVSAINKGGTISLTAHPTDPGIADTYTYAWSVMLGSSAYTDLGGASTTASTFSFVAGRSGSYVVSVTVSDRDNGTGSASTAAITASAVPPSVAITGEPGNAISEGSPVTLTATPTDLGTDESFTYQWTLSRTVNSVTTTYPTSSALTNASLMFTPEDKGTYSATCIVTDSDGTHGTATSQTITVNDVNPMVTITGMPIASINEGAAISLLATPIEGSNDRSYTYAWSVVGSGDATGFTLPGNTVVNTAAFSFTPPTGGSYVATVVVTDDEGGTTTAHTAGMTVANLPPISTITGAPISAINEGTAVNLSAAGSEPGSGHTFTYGWSVTDSATVVSPGVASASSSVQSTPDEAFDGNPSTNWYASSNNSWLQTDLGNNPAVVTGYKITSENNLSFNPSSWTFLGSNDGSNFTTLDTESNQSFSPPDTNSYTFPNTTAYRYYRLNITAGNGGPYIAVAELGLYSTSPVASSNTSAINFTPNIDGSYVATLTTTDENSQSNTQVVHITVNNVAPTVTIAGEPGTSITEGTPVSLTSTESEPGPGAYTYQWTVMNGSNAVSLVNNATATTSALSFTPLVEGNYVASLDVTDSEGGTTTVSSTNMTVTAAAPTASMTGVPQGSVNEFTPITLGVTASDANPANTDTYAWSVTKNSAVYTLPNDVVTTGSSFTFTPADAATYNVSCVVTNTEGASTTVHSGNITVLPIAPTVSIMPSVGPYAEGTPITVTPTVSDVGTSDSVTYAWSVFRDGNAYTPPGNPITTGATFTFTPANEGYYRVFLTATDSGGASTAVSTELLAVADVAPTVAITGAPQGNVNEGTGINFGTTVTQVGLNDSVASYSWSVKNGNQTINLGSTPTNNSTLSFTPLNQGNYVATVVVTNAGDNGISGASTTQQSSTINVVNVPPTVTVTGTTGPVTDGSNLSFSAAATEPGNNTLSYLWTVKRNGHLIPLPNATSTTSSTLSFAAGRAGSFVATCVVTDSEGGSATGVSNSVTVTDVAPTVTIAGAPLNASTIPAGTAVALTATAADAGADEHFTYAWSVKLNNLSYTPSGNVATTNSTFDFTPDRVGSYVATVIVTDSDGGATTQTANIGVTDVAPTVTVIPPATVDEGQTLTFNGAATSTLLSGESFTYVWTVSRNSQPFTLPDGTLASGPTLSFIAPQGGTYVATLAVTGIENSTGTHSASGTVNWVSPTVSITGTPVSTAYAGSAINLAAVPSEAGSGHTYTYLWSVTRNTVAYTLPNNVSTTGSSFSFTPRRAGSYVASLQITDEDGQTANQTTMIAVAAVAPIVGISGAPQAPSPEGTAISLTASASSAATDETFSYLWSVTKDNAPYSLPNNVITNSPSLTFTPGLAGSYVASVVVTDLDGGHTTQSTSAMAVSATAPTVTVSGQPGSAVSAGTVVNLSASATDTGAAEQFSYVWNVMLNGQPYPLPQGTVTNTSSLSFATTGAGFYVATAVASDTSAQVGSGNSGNIYVSAVPPTVTITGAPSSAINEGAIVALTAVPADADTADIYTYTWSVTKNNNPFTLPQNTVTNAANFSFAPNDPGTFVASVYITDKANLSATAAATITSVDVAPTVSISGAPQAPVNVGTPLSFTSTTSSSGVSDTISSYSWSVTKNNISYTPPGNPATNLSTFSFTPDGQGNYVVTLNAMDNYGQTGTSSTSSILIRPVAPAVTIAGTTGAINEGDAIALTATATDPASGDTYNYVWTVTRNSLPFTLPNTVSTTLPTLNFNANLPGTYVATVTVTDIDSQATTVSSSTITAADVAPTVTITGEPGGSIAENSTAVTLTAAPYEPGSGQTYTYAWSVTKNNLPYTLPSNVLTSASTLTFTPPRTGSYIATCLVTDGASQTGTADSTPITVTAVNPLVTITGTPIASIGEGTPVSLSASASDPATSDTFTYAWTIYRNSVAYTPATVSGASTYALNFTPDQPGTYTATCTVTDADSAVGSQTTSSIAVTTVNPAVTITGTPSSSIAEGTAVALTASATSPRTGDTYSYAWAIYRNNVIYTPATVSGASTAALNFTADRPGTYTATCTVTDADSAIGAATTSSFTVTTVNPAVTITGTPSSSIGEGTAVSLTATATSPRTADTYTYAWTLYRNNVAYTPATIAGAGSSALSFTADQPGTYKATCQVTDADSAVGSATTSSFTVTTVNPTVTITGTPGSSIGEGAAVSLTAAATSPRTNDTYTYAWTILRNGIAYTPASLSGAATSALSFTPDRPGNYTATCTVTDADSAVGTATTSLMTVTAVNPAVTISGTPGASIGEGTAVNLTASATSPRTSDTYAYAWTITKDNQPYTPAVGTVLSARALNFTPGQPGAYVATCTVTDADSAIGIASTTSITVTAVNPSVVITGTPSSAIGEGTAINLTANPGSPRTNDTYTYAWTITKDNQSYTPANPTLLTSSNLSFIPGLSGTYDATCTVTDIDGKVGAASTGAITVTTVSPTVTISNAPSSVAEGTAISLVASASSPRTGDTFAYAWTITRNNSSFIPASGTVLNASSLNFTAGLPGSYVATCTVTDADSAVGTASTSAIAVTTVSPIVSISTAPTSVSEGTSIILSAAAISPRTGDTFSYAWTITRNNLAYMPAGGTVLNSFSLNFTPGLPGTYAATCTVTDADGSMGSASTPSITVTTVNPAVSITGTPNSSIPEGTAISLTAAATSPRTSDTFTYAWTIYRNSVAYTPATVSGATTYALNFTPDQPGTYTATCTVTDADSAVGSQTTSSITVTTVNPAVTISGTPVSSIAEGTAVNLAASATSPRTGDTYSYLWTISRNSVSYTPASVSGASTANLSFTPDRPGTYTATCTVTDADSAVGSQTTTSITVTTVNPAVTITTAPTTVTEGTAVNLTATATSPRVNDTFIYAWAIKLNGSAYTPTVVTGASTASLGFTPDQPGAYVATCTVTDLDSAVGTVSSTSIAVTKVNPVVTITTAPTTVTEGTAVNLTATATSPRVTDRFTYAWAIKLNGSAYTPSVVTGADTASLGFTPDQPGAYVATCTATDVDGGVGTVSTTSIAVTAVDPTVTISTAPTTTPEGTAVNLTATASSPRLNDTFSYAWTIMLNGSAYTPAVVTGASTASLSFTPDQPGNYAATCVVTDTDQEIGTASSTSITVTKVNPAVTITTAPTTVGEGTAINLTASATSRRINDTFSYSWSITLNGQAYTPSVVTGLNTAFLGYTPDQPGAYVATCTVTDLDSAIGTASASTTATAVNPVVTITGTPVSSIAEGTALSLVASATSPRTADTFTYAWTLTRNSFAYTPASGTVLNTAALNFTPGQPGLYVANCTFTDIDGAVSSQRTSSIQVTTVSPTLSITPAPSSLAEGTALSLTASATSPRTGDTFTYTWALTLNNAPFTPINGTILNAAALNFTPLQPGTYVATCTVTDLDGASASLSTPSIPVTAVSPLVVVTGAPITSAEGTQLNLSVSASSPRSNDTFSYVWSITRNNSNYTPASGTILNAANLHFTPGQPGAYIATCTITDIDGAVGSQSSSSITVTSVSPGVTLSGAPGSSVGEGTPINLLATPTSPRTNDTYSYAWTVTKNAQPYTLLNSVSTSNASFSFTPNTDGTYIANVVVTDLDSATRTVSTSPITVANVPPTVTIQNLPGSAISTGQSFSLTAHATEPGNGGYTYAWTVNGAQLPLSTSQTFSGTAQLSGAYNVVLTVTDAEGGVGTATGIITVSDLAPTATITGAPSTTPEGTAITLASTASDPGTQFGETFTYLWTVTRNGSSYPVTSATASNFTFTPNEYGNYVTTLTVTDSQGTATATTANITVTDVTPTSTLAAVPTAVRGMGVTFAGTVADPGTADGETIAWNYGDGTTQTFASTAANAMNPTHAYVAAGTYTATMTVTDSGGLSTTSTQSVSVVGAEVAADPFSAGKTALLVGGTTGSDSIKFYSETGGRVKVTLDGASIGLFAPTGHIVVEGVGSGSDTISIDAAIKLPAVLYGNAGTDSLYGGGGNNILIAGTGNDSLFAGPGADILIGGNGKDTLTGGAGNDLLVGGNWPFATNQSTLAAIDAQWTRTDESFATIVHQLRGVQAGSLAPSTLISTSNVTNSNGEFLICGSGRDWLLPVGGDVVEGFITSKDVESGGAVSLAHARHRPKKL